MKKYISKVAVGLMLAVASSSCSDFLNEDLKSELAPDNTYTSSYGFEVGINGLYAIALLNTTLGVKTVHSCTMALVPMRFSR